MTLPSENPHSRRKPGPTLQRLRPRTSGSRLSPGMRIFWDNVPPEQRRSDSAQSDSGLSYSAAWGVVSWRGGAAQPVVDRATEPFLRDRRDRDPGEVRPVEP